MLKSKTHRAIRSCQFDSLSYMSPQAKFGISMTRYRGTEARKKSAQRRPGPGAPRQRKKGRLIKTRESERARKRGSARSELPASNRRSSAMPFKNNPPNYECLRRIGRGNYGTVYHARDMCNGREYCVKQIEMVSFSQAERDAAQREVQLLASLDHPGVVRRSGRCE